MGHLQELHSIIHIMSKGEKRYFSLQSKKYGQDGDRKNYTKIFKLIEKVSDFNVTKIERKLSADGLTKNSSTVNRNLINSILGSMANYSANSSLSDKIDQVLLEVKWLKEKGLTEIAIDYVDKLLTQHSPAEFPLENIKLCDIRISLISNYSEANKLHELITRTSEAFVNLSVKTEVIYKQQILYNILDTINYNRSQSIESEYLSLLKKNLLTPTKGTSATINQEFQNELFILYYSASANFYQTQNHITDQIHLYEKTTSFIRKHHGYYLSLYAKKITCEIHMNELINAENTFERYTVFVDAVWKKEGLPNFIYKLNLCEMELRLLYFKKEFNKIIAHKDSQQRLLSKCGNLYLDKKFTFAFYWAISYFQLGKYDLANSVLRSIIVDNKSSMTHWNYLRNIRLILIKAFIYYKKNSMELFRYNLELFQKITSKNIYCLTEKYLLEYMLSISENKKTNEAYKKLVADWESITDKPLEGIYLSTFGFVKEIAKQL